MGIWHEYYINRIFFAFFGTDSGAAHCSLWEKISSKRDCYFFASSACLFGKTIYPITSIYHNFWSSVLPKNIQNLATCFALGTFVSIFTILLHYMDLHTLLSWALRARTKDIPNFVWNWCFCLFKILNPLVTHEEKRGFVFFSKGFLRTWHVGAHCGHKKASVGFWQIFCAGKVSRNMVCSNSTHPHQK